jgi:hypothetical protein
LLYEDGLGGRSPRAASSIRPPAASIPAHERREILGPNKHPIAETNAREFAICDVLPDAAHADLQALCCVGDIKQIDHAFS